MSKKYTRKDVNENYCLLVIICSVIFKCNAKNQNHNFQGPKCCFVIFKDQCFIACMHANFLPVVQGSDH